MSDEIQETAEAALTRCAFERCGGVKCRFKSMRGSSFCFWHNPQAAKTGPLVGPLLARLVSRNVNLEGFELAGVDLECRRLSGALMIHVNLEGAHLFKTHLEGAHLFGASLRGASLFKALLDGANLRTADVTDANLLGASLRDTKLEGLVIGPHTMVANERTGDVASRGRKREEASRAWQEAEEIYLSLLNNNKAAGRHEEASEIFYRLMVVKRKLMPRGSVHRWGSKFMDLICGYGERPGRVILAGMALIFVSALFFFAFGVRTGADSTVVFDASASAEANGRSFMTCLYFSIITMTTTGYGDVTPTDATRLFAASEAFAGAFLMAVFVLVFGRKMMR